MVAIVSVTAVLVSEPPARAEVAPRGPYATTAQLGDLELNLVVDPATAGLNQIHLYLTNSSGQPTDVDEATVSATLASRQIGPIRLEAHPAGPGHFIVHGAQLALAGRLAAARRGSAAASSTRRRPRSRSRSERNPVDEEDPDPARARGRTPRCAGCERPRHRQSQNGAGGQLRPPRDPRPRRSRRRADGQGHRSVARERQLRQLPAEAGVEAQRHDGEAREADHQRRGRDRDGADRHRDLGGRPDRAR